MKFPNPFRKISNELRYFRLDRGFRKLHDGGVITDSQVNYHIHHPDSEVLLAKVIDALGESDGDRISEIIGSMNLAQLEAVFFPPLEVQGEDSN